MAKAKSPETDSFTPFHRAEPPRTGTAWIVGIAIAGLATAGSAAAATPPKGAIGMPNPASVYCKDQGGTLEIRKGEKGDTGYCHLPDGRIIEEWALFRARKTETPSPDASHNARNALDWAGTYRGTLPCADCEGIETIVTLLANGRYISRSRYLGRNGNASIDEGTVEWDRQGTVITLSGRERAVYRVGEGRLTRLALDGSPITSSLAQHYVLAKEAATITEKYWKLIELNGRPVPALSQEPHMILKAEGNHVSGYSGCNRFSGTFTLNEKASRIRFGRMISTQAACPDGMTLEKAFNEVLARADSYSLKGDTLTLNRARMAPLARFEVVWLK